MKNEMRHIVPKDVPVREVFAYLLGGVAPRPIALVSTLSADGIPNLSPFSFFNAFGSNPPMITFAPSRRGRDASLKDTYHNLIATKECVVQCVTYDMVQQVNLASTEYPADVNEFVKSGLTPIPSDIVKPARVAESPFQMECKMVEMKSYGDGPSSGNLAICEVLKFHISENIFDNGTISPNKIDLVARMGADFYCRASGNAVFIVQKPGDKIGVGYEQIPQYIKESNILTANNLGQLGLIEHAPSEADVDRMVENITDSNGRHYKDYEMLVAEALTSNNSNEMIEQAIKAALEQNNIDFAWKAVILRGRVATKQKKTARK
jgi:flavin reductase (DIM6/NTAB) family NADH-FMN oxidoreductase RutF